jgi:hypothetical protein
MQLLCYMKASTAIQWREEWWDKGGFTSGGGSTDGCGASLVGLAGLVTPS